MKTLLIAVIVVMALAVSMIGAPSALAHTPPPEGVGCPQPFAAHHAHEHSHGGGHNHIGNDTDQNDDGWICVKHVGEGGNNHVHIDNNLPQ